MARLLDNTVTFTETILRTDTATDFRHVIGRGRHFIGFFQPAICRQHQPVRDIIMQRAMHLTERHTTLRTTAGLLLGLIADELALYFMPVLAAGLSLALRWHFTVNLDEFQHPLRHGVLPIKSRPQRAAVWRNRRKDLSPTIVL